MTSTEFSNTSPGLRVATLGTADLRAALMAGWTDFKRAPAFGLFFALVYVAGGLALWFGLGAMGQPVWFVPIAVGFPLLAPFAAIGLYEVSRRLERDEPLSWAPVLGALRGRGDGQLALMAVGVLIVFGFWIILARGIFAIFMSRSGIGFDSIGLMFSVEGIFMLLVGSAVGAAVALGLFAITVISLPMLLDREVDFVTAMIASVETVRQNPRTMLIWAGMIAGLLFAAMIPAFLGLFIVLPVLGHATWHLYRRALG
ncbi:hypothetical protein ROE7235_00663 [Roseibaca ekhonensis]|uniref:DUF2189 domain-containing protein n=1 Tax=Roseinatronobacter ekhonensis TaxID=254356 RepID=A0A3B0M591_9RHOB|nr:DUF2189 domain-containing protein [Roseibaca ekhonensis]SUZ30933.1 hypothetical protein ROE7235_00663 [Roseibaca ekhonensis]